MFVKYQENEDKKIQDFVKKVKKDGFDSIRVEYFVYDDKGLEISFRAMKKFGIGYGEEERSITARAENATYEYNLQKIVVVFDMDLEIVNFITDTHTVEFYSKNNKDISIGDSESIYFIDTIFIHKWDKKGNKKTKIRHDEICFRDNKMVFLR